MSKILAPALGTLLALAPNVASAAPRKQLDLLSAQTLGEVTLVVNDQMVATACTPAWEETARKHGFDVYRDATTRCYAWDQAYKFADINRNIGVVMRPQGNTDTDACISASMYIDEFTTNGQRFLVIDPEDVTANLVCPPIEEIPPVSSPVPELVTNVEIPTVGSFTQLDPQVMKEAAFLKPVKLGLEEAQVDAKVDNPKNLLHRGRLGVDVYAKYETVKFDSSTGRLTVRLDNGKKEDECTVAITYTNSFIQDGQRYFVVTNDFGTNPKECLETNPETDVSVEQAAVVSTLAAEATGEPWHVKVYGDVGYNEEELGSEYSLGGAGYGSLAVQVRSPFAPVCLGVNADAIIAEGGAGFEGLTGTVGYCNDRFDVALQLGSSWEPRAPLTALNGAPTLGLLAHMDVLELGPWAMNVGASVRADLYGGGVFPANMTVFVGATYDIRVGGNGGSKESRASEKTKYHLVTTTKPYSYQLPTPGPEDKAKRAEAVRLDEEMRLKASNNKWDGAEADYLRVLDLGIPLPYKTHMKGAQASQGFGDIQKCYERLLMAQSLATTELERKETGDWLNDIESNYASVMLVVDVRGEVSFQPVDSPFPPDQRASIALAQVELAEDGSFEGFIPILPYTFGGQTVEGLVPVSSDVTTEIHLER